MSYLNIYEERKSPSGKTSIYVVANSVTATILGYISWWGAWRKYVFKPNEEMVFDSNCLNEIESFLDEATAKQKEKNNVPNG